MSPTTQTLLIGVALLAIFVGFGRLISGAMGITKAVKLFFPLWLAYCAWHMSVGMGHGYSFLSELPFLLINFGVPALAAWLINKRWGG